MMDAIESVKEVISVLLRRIVIVCTIVFFCTTIAVLYALSLPKLYRAVSIIQMEPSAVSDSLSNTTDSTRTMQQLQRTEQRLMASSNLISVIKKFDLYSEIPNFTVRQKIYLLRTASEVTQVNIASLQWRTGYSTDVPPTAIAISVTLNDPALVANVANEFAANVLDQSKKRRAKRTSEVLKFFESEEQRVGAGITKVENEIAEFRRVNAELLPESIADKRYQSRILENAFLELDRQLIELNEGNEGQQRSNVSRQIAQIEDQKYALDLKVLKIKESIQAAPQIEKMLNVLQRRLVQLEEQFTVITRHRAEAEMGRMLEISVQSENFAILEVANVPAHPIAPNRRKIGMMGVAVGIIIAFAVVYLLENIRPVIRNSSQMERLSGMRPVVTIPRVVTTNDRYRRNFANLAVVLVVIAGLFVGLIVLEKLGVPIVAMLNEKLSARDWQG